MSSQEIGPHLLPILALFGVESLKHGTQLLKDETLLPHPTNVGNASMATEKQISEGKRS